MAQRAGSSSPSKAFNAHERLLQTLKDLQAQRAALIAEFPVRIPAKDGAATEEIGRKTCRRSDKEASGEDERDDDQSQEAVGRKRRKLSPTTQALAPIAVDHASADDHSHNHEHADRAKRHSDSEDQAVDVQPQSQTIEPSHHTLGPHTEASQAAHNPEESGNRPDPPPHLPLHSHPGQQDLPPVSDTPTTGPSLQPEKKLEQDPPSDNHPSAPPPNDPSLTLSLAHETVTAHIKLLHRYNRVKEIGLGLLGLIADRRGVRLVEVMSEFGVEGVD